MVVYPWIKVRSRLPLFRLIAIADNMAGKAGDLELDAESMQDLSSTEVVRKSIPLKLKKPKLKLKSSKSSKSKKDKKSSSSLDHKETSSESKSHKSSKKQRSTTTIDGFPKSGKGELDWSQKIVAVGDKVQDPMIHMCEHCNHPILVYGRLTPCKHIFCLTCADKVNGQCPRCRERVERIEPAGIGQIFVCTFGGSKHGYSGCRRSYLSQRDLLAHIKHRHQKDGIPRSDADTFAKTLDERTQQTARMPFLGAPFLPSNMRPHFAPVNPQQMPVDGRMLQGMPPPREQVFMEGQRLPIMGQFPQAAPPQQFQPLTQPGFRPDQSMLQRAAVQNQMVDQFLPPGSVGQFANVNVSRPPPISMPHNPMQFPSSGGQFLQAGMQQPTQMQQHSGLQQPSGMPPQGRVDGTMPPGRLEPMQQLPQPPMQRVEGVQMGHTTVDGTWQGVPQGVAQGVPAQDWASGQRSAEMQGGFSAADPSRFQTTF